MDRGRRKGQIKKSGDRKTVLRVFNYLRETYPNESVRDIVKRTSEATSVGERTVYRVRKEALRAGRLITPKRTIARGRYRSSRKIKFDAFVMSSIRKIVHSFFG